MADAVQRSAGLNPPSPASLASTKRCPLCAETIQAAASLCPFCQSPQHRYARWRPELALAVAVLIMLAVLGGFAAWIESRFSPDAGRRFAPHRQELSIERARLEPGRRTDYCHFIGYVTNRGTCPWRVQSLELRFENPDGTLLEVRQLPVRQPFVVLPAQEAAFQVELEELPATVRAAPFTARVQRARDGRQPARDGTASD